ncbi:methyltransferase [Corticibacterium sp. UT-5YL-CI-8]|nr:methyltransferase [Tianweitania sp. UT-5YL-CI-8]
MTAEPETADAGEPAATTLDAFHRGGFWLVQPAKAGHRAGMDAMTLAASVPSAFAGHLADFGAGAGAAGLAVASRCTSASVTLVEIMPEMALYAEATLAHPANAGLKSRAKVIRADVELTGRARVEAGLADNSFDFVIMNPPFNAAHDRATPDPLRQKAHVMDDGLFERWMKSAAAVVRPRGGVAVIARPDALAPLLDAVKGRFGSVQIVPIHPRADLPAIRIVLRGIRAARGPLSLCPPLVLHDAGEAFSARAEDIVNGRASLFGD